MNKKLKLRMSIMIAFLLLLFGSVFGYDGVRSYFMGQYFAHYQQPPVSISAEAALQENWQPYLSAIGTLQAVNGVNISPEISGIIRNINFQSGQMVQQGQLLVKIDDSVEQADLMNNLAVLQLNQLNFQRLQNLYLKKAASQADRDQAEATFKQAQAAVAKTQALIAQKNIAAPFSGLIGIRNVNVGQYVSPGTALVSLQAIAPIYVNFYVPEQNLPQLTIGQIVELTIDTHPQDKYSGKINAINAVVDVNTHNIMVQAILPNQRQQLYPGIFAKVHVLLPQQQQVITVPQTAVTFTLFGNSVYVVHQEGKDKDGKPILKVKQQYIETGDARDGKIIIQSGVNAGDIVVTSGQLKLQDGSTVIINNSVKLNQKQNEIY